MTKEQLNALGPFAIVNLKRVVVRYVPPENVKYETAYAEASAVPGCSHYLAPGLISVDRARELVAEDHRLVDFMEPA